MTTSEEPAAPSYDRFRGAAMLLLATLLGLAWISYSRETSPLVADNTTVAPRAGYLAPPFELTTLAGETLTLAELQGTPVVLNFWATWCVPCRTEMPLLERVASRYADDLLVLGINNGESAALVQSFVTDYGLTFPVLLDTNYLVGDLYGVRALPTTLFVASDGRIEEVFTGILNEAILEVRVQALLLP